MPSLQPNAWSDRDVRNFWNSAAPVYVGQNEKVAETHSQRFTESLKHLAVADGLRVVNIVSRDCEAEEHLRKACPGLRLVHAEISEGLIQLAAGLRPNVVQVQFGSFSFLPFADGCFDRVLSLETLEHTPRPLAFLEELYRIAKDGAVLVLSCPPATSEIPYRLYTKFVGGHGEGPHRFLSSKEVLALLGKAGWRIRGHIGTCLLPVGPGFVRRAAEKLIRRFQNSRLSEWGIRQFYVCHKGSS
jgi:SAM-dependent methyltransferase